MRFTFLFVLTISIFLQKATAQEAALIGLPMIGAVTQTTAEVLVMTKTNEELVVKYWSNTDTITAHFQYSDVDNLSKFKLYYFKFQLKNLKANTKYQVFFYKKNLENSDKITTFRTAPLKNEIKDFDFLASALRVKQEKLEDRIKKITEQIETTNSELIVSKLRGESTSKKCPINKFCYFSFEEKDKSFGDLTFTPIGSGTDYKVNLLNYNLYFGDELKLPFQLYVSEVDKKDSEEENNNTVISGSKLVNIAPTIDYALEKNLNLRLFYTRNVTVPFITTAFPRRNTTFGFSLRYTLSG